MLGRSGRMESEDALHLENAHLRRALDQLDVLEEIAAATVTDRPLDSILELIVEKCVACLGVEQGAVHLFDETVSQEQPLRTLMRHVKSDAASPLIRQLSLKLRSAMPSPVAVSWVAAMATLPTDGWAPSLTRSRRRET